MATSSSAPVEMTDAQIDNMEFENFRIDGAIVWTSYRDRFEFFPVAGFGRTRSLQDEVPFDVYARRISEDHRRVTFTFAYVDGGQRYQARLFTRVQEGKQSENKIK